MNPLFTNFRGFILASRVPNLVIIAVTQVLAAVVLLDKPAYQVITFSFVGLIITTQMIAAAGYLINDYYDQKIDMINRPKKVIVGVILKRRVAMAAHTLLNLGAIGLGFLIEPVIALVHTGSAFGLWLYSNHLRRLPFLGNLTIAILSGMTFLIVSIYYRHFTDILMIYAFFAFLVTFIREIIKDMEDVKGEAAFGCKTIPVIWGIRGAKIVIYLLTSAGGTLLVYFIIALANHYVDAYFLLISPVFVWFIFSVVKADTQKQFSLLHAVSNWIILSGIVSIIFLHV